MRHKNLLLIGTSHIARQSLVDVERAIDAEKPGIIALELDRGRLHALLSGNREKPGWRMIKLVGLKGWLFSVIGAWIEKRLGEKVGVSPGSEMMQAFRMAKDRRIRVALIDQPIEITLRRFSQELTWKEKFRLAWDLVWGGVFGRGEKITFDLAKVPEQRIIEKMILQVKDRYPNIYRVLVEERNHVMARNLAHIMARNADKSVVAVVGAGHEKEIIALVKRYLNAIDVVGRT